MDRIHEDELLTYAPPQFNLSWAFTFGRQLQSLLIARIALFKVRQILNIRYKNCHAFGNFVENYILMHVHYAALGDYNKATGQLLDVSYPNLNDMKNDLLSSTPIDDADIIFIWEAIAMGQPFFTLARAYDKVLSFRSKGLSPHNRIKFYFSHVTDNNQYYYKVIKTVIVDEDQWYQ